MKGEILPDHIPVNKFTLTIVGLFSFTCTEISGIEDELETTELPDRTVASGGFRKASEFSASVPMHHAIVQTVLENWFKQSQDPVAPDYKKAATLTHESVSGAIIRTASLAGMFPKKRKLPDLEFANEGEMAVVEWTFSIDDIEFI